MPRQVEIFLKKWFVTCNDNSVLSYNLIITYNLQFIKQKVKKYINFVAKFHSLD